MFSIFCFSATQDLCEKAIDVLSGRVCLDHAIQSGAEALRNIDVMLSELTLSLAPREQMWNSVETLLEFIFPSGLLTYNMSSVLSFCLSVGRKSPLNHGIHMQVRVWLLMVSLVCVDVYLFVHTVACFNVICYLYFHILLFSSFCPFPIFPCLLQSNITFLPPT